MEWYWTTSIIAIGLVVYFNLGYLYWYLDDNKLYPGFLKFLWVSPKSWGAENYFSNAKISVITFWLFSVILGMIIFCLWTIFGGIAKIIINKKIDYL